MNSSKNQGSPTGRLCSPEPKFQDIPTGNRKLAEVLSLGHLAYERAQVASNADYSKLEARVAAYSLSPK
ncbi:hypothetical protein LC612_33015 [Nostoc sp. CHAB 5834]|nr:hypothetical protein [Nostoc sp. CHAB 5834]